MKYLLRAIIVLFIIGVVGVIGTFFYFSRGLNLDIDKLVNYKPAVTTQVYDRNGELIANIFDKKHRLYVPYKEIPPRLIEALVAIEDTTFFEHSGLNYEAIVRAVMKDVKHMKLKEGASTLTQQLVKNTILTREKKIKRKVNEALLALKVERKLSKEDILERYLNEIFFGHNYYGVKTAAKGYFRKDLNDLNLKEIAILVGLPKAPSTYDPTRHLDLSLSRANTVLNRMHAVGWISAEELQKYEQFRPKVYDDPLSKNRVPYILNEVVKRVKKNYPDIRTGGYQIYTTIDLELQNLAKESIRIAHDGVLKRSQKYNSKLKEPIDYSDLNGAMVVLENRSAEVLALVGGVDYKKSVFNRAIQSRRQPGSSMKPFIYQVALDAGYSTQSQLTDISRTFKSNSDEKEWKPKNYEKNYKGLIPLREALVHSRNLATINLVSELGLGYIQRELTKMGFKELPADLSLALGTFGISPLDFSAFYTIFSNYGVKKDPILIKKVIDIEGREKNFSAKEERVTSPAQAYLMTSILKDVVNRGTGVRVKVQGVEIAGKTGTTNDYKDAWFCGFSPEIQSVVWFGKDDNKPMHRETGAKASGPAFRHFYESYLKIHPETQREFDIPHGVREVKYTKGIEYFTDVSKPPNSVQSTKGELESELLF